MKSDVTTEQNVRFLPEVILEYGACESTSCLLLRRTSHGGVTTRHYLRERQNTVKECQSVGMLHSGG